MTSTLKVTLAFICLPFLSFAQSQYNYSIDLKNVIDDRVAVELKTPTIGEDIAIFSFPMAIPGSYSKKDYGRFINDFEAFTKDGTKIKIEKLNVNQYKITDAKNLASIKYTVSDTWDENCKNFIFQPGGSNIEVNKNFVINNHAFFGYFEDYKMLPFEVNVGKPSEMHASTHLDVDRSNSETDILKAKNYVYLADNPVIYCKPDTTSFMVGNTKINVSVYSATGKVKSNQIAEYLKPISVALQTFFKGLPVDSYQFLYYFEDPKKALVAKDQGGYGALEHNYSSLYYLPEAALEKQLKSMVNEVSSHEFLHIQTPLNLHSEEIENFDYINPKMSQHLWLYEGATEYFANLVQVQNGLITEKEFFKNMRDKINQSAEYEAFSMTEMSKNVLTDKYKEKYKSVYNKGALISMMLDIQIREATNNQKDLKSVIQVLSAKYGPSKPFKDDQLFADLITASHPSVNDFINNYILGDTELPYEEFFSKVAYEFSKQKSIPAYYPGPMGLKFNENTHSFSFIQVKSNPLKIKEEDVFLKINNTYVNEENINEVWEKYFKLNVTDPVIAITVLRKGEELTLSDKIFSGAFQMKNYLAPIEEPTETQLLLLKLLLNKSTM